MNVVNISYENLRFSHSNAQIRVVFLNIYYFYLDEKDLKKIGDFKVKDNSIQFSTDKKHENVERKFEYLLVFGFQNLRSTINGKPTLYVNRNSGIPLIGTNEFGVIDRGTNTIEVKPITTCNIDCIFCSVDHTKRSSDVVVEKDYLVEELFKVIKIKKNKVNIHIGSQGDSSIYGDLVPLVRDMRSNKQINSISMVTNGIVITKKLADKLIEAGLTHFHISLHSLNQEKATELANIFYPVKKVKELSRYIAEETSAKVILVPVLVHGVNDEDVEDVIMFAKEIKAGIGVQNCLEYKFGKKIQSPLSMQTFYEKLSELEKKLDINLTALDSDLEFFKDNTLKKPFKKGDIIQVEIKAKDRIKNAMIGVSKKRVVTILNCHKKTGTVFVKLIRDKNNIFAGVLT